MTPREPIDWLVLTAANQAQARAYRAQLKARERDGCLAGVANWLVVPDPPMPPPAPRIGSGGSTLFVLRELLQRSRGSGVSPVRASLVPSSRGARVSQDDRLEGQRILLIHSGGQSRRLPAFAAQGKVFVPVPDPRHSGTPIPLLDLLLDDLRPIASRSPGRITIATGDVYLGLRQHNLTLQGHDVIGVAFPGDTSRAVRHGVYVLDAQGRVTRMLQKPNLQELKAAEALLPNRREPAALIDTGLVSLSAKAAGRWLNWAKDRPATELACDLYADLLPALVAQASRLCVDPATPRTGRTPLPHPKARSTHPRLGRIHVHIVPTCDFVHIGSSAELLHAWHRAPARRLVLDSDIASRRLATLPSPCIIEGCSVSARIRLAPHSMLIGLPRTRLAIRVSRSTGLLTLPIDRAAWACLPFGIRDDFKTTLESGGTFLNRPLRQLVQRVSSIESLWPDANAERSLWTARIITIAPIDRTLALQSWLLDATSKSKAPRAWIKTQRTSLAELLSGNRINHTRLLALREQCRKASLPDALVERAIANDHRPSIEFAREIRGPHDTRRALQAIHAALPTLDPLQASRILWIARDIHTCSSKSRPRTLAKIGDLEAQAFASVARAVAIDHDPVGRASSPPSSVMSSGRVARSASASTESRARARPSRWHIATGHSITAQSPLRVDLAGGWSDTPPICQHFGGLVLNAAITLDGQRPIRVSATRLHEPLVRITSEDQARDLTIRSTHELRAPFAPSDWSSLARAALVVAGIAPRASASLATHLDSLGGGLHLTLRSDAPKGSGLGASSILGATLLACLDRALGRPYQVDRTLDRTLALEQLMGTGGGWQDQAGGIAPGAKLVRSDPGLRQHLTLQPVPLAPLQQLHSQGRLLLYFTGYQRLAANVLHAVVARFLAREPAMLRTIVDLKAGAEQMHADLARSDTRAFARGLAHYWQLKKSIDPGASPPHIENLVRPIRHELLAHELPGAGGGGFLFMIAKSRAAAGRVRKALLAHPPKRSARFFDFAFDRDGLVFTHHDGGSSQHVPTARSACTTLSLRERAESRGSLAEHHPGTLQ